MRYISDHVISFSIKVNGRSDSVRVNFLPLSSGGSSYSTEVESVMVAMEKSPMYGKVYRRAPECASDSIRAKKPVKVFRKKPIEVDSVLGWQDAIDYLVENCGSHAGKLVTPDEILKEAEAKGVVFPRLN